MNSAILPGIVAGIVSFLLYGPISIPALSNQFGPGFVQRATWFWLRAVFYFLVAFATSFLRQEIGWEIQWNGSVVLNRFPNSIIIGIFVADIFNRLFSFAVVQDGKTKVQLGGKGSLILSYFDGQLANEIERKKQGLIDLYRKALVDGNINYTALCEKAIDYTFNEANGKELVGEFMDIWHTTNSIATPDSHNRGKINRALQLLLNHFGKDGFIAKMK